MNNYSIKWTQPYTIHYGVSPIELEALKDLVIEQVLESGEFTEANVELQRIMQL